eukprot:m.479373 g.479373  ORF g.479373 m.479373 type:complete len:278 (-) comp21424_c0_seq1:257-1090(-)
MDAILTSEGRHAAADIGLHKVSDDLYTAGQLDAEQLKQAHEQFGVKSIFCTRAPTEAGFEEFTELSASLGIHYEIVPIKEALLSHEFFDQLTAKLDVAPKPALVHCRSGKRATTLAMAHAATRSGTAASLDEKHAPHLEKIAEEFLLSFVRDYLAAKVNLADSLPDITQIADDLLISPQFTEEQLRAAVSKHGIKSVLNLRSMEEAGQIGFGFLLREEEVVKSMGIEYVNIPTKAQTQPTEEDMARITEAFERLPKPVLVHCRTMKRSTHVASGLKG